MNITQAIQHLYPGTLPERDFFLRDDGDGPYIEKWNLEEPKPTWEQLESVMPIAALKAIQKDLEAGVQAFLDRKAAEVGYDNIYTACTYAEEPAVPEFQIAGQALRAWRSLVWATCYQVLNAAVAGERPIPTKEQLIAELPAFAPPSI